MCSFLFTNKQILDLERSNYLIQKRGPDLTNILREGEMTYVHNLLSITGDFTPQPLLKDDLCLLYNGEIYNFPEFGDYKSDGECILDLFRESGISSLSNLDGEFSILIHDRGNKKIYLCTDTFGTKPLYYSIQDGKIGVSSYPNPLTDLGFTSVKRCPPNSILTIEESNFSLIKTSPLYDFDLRQFKDSYSDWIGAFDESVHKRSLGVKHEMLLPLSSGYDSGAIACSLNKIGIDYISYSLIGRENVGILNSRIEINKNTKKEIIRSITTSEIEFIKSQFRRDVHPFYYGPSPEEITHDGFDDPGAISLYHLLKSAKEKFGAKIVFSGHGSDEIMSNIPNYGFRTSNPGKFTDTLEGIFPWGNFYQGSQSSYLMKEECIAGSLGMETRYPFLDRKVVQEYLNLSSELKNRSYKPSLEEYFVQNSYPFYQEKIGFSY
jgi:asparagine synthetase B (glutamine-hydrolysing)